jgi:cell division protein FtsQ
LVEQHVRKAEAFATETIDISGLQTLTRERVLARAGLAYGQNVFEVSPEEAERRMLEDPWVQSAKVTRRLPGSYAIELTEQKPALVLVLGDELLLVGQDASVLKPVEPGDPVDLPLLTGTDADRFRAELDYRSSLLVAAVGLLHDYRDAGLWAREPLAEIRVEPDQGLTLYIGDDATQVRLGKRPFAKKLRRLRGIFEQLSRDKERPLYVYLDNIRRPDRATVRLR